jgi:hypothetical protein
MAKHRMKRKEAGHSPQATAKNKALFLMELRKGHTPDIAAEHAKIARRTAYNWKQEDQEFAAAWEDAHETGLDRIEDKVKMNAIDGSSVDAHFILRHRRRDVFGNVEEKPQHTNYFLNVTLQDQIKRMQRLGLPLPVIESDREEDYAPTGGDSDGDNRK